jgi:diguanylate cyclase (GGDEF)-like protein/PAS domain S-box-containing protein
MASFSSFLVIYLVLAIFVSAIISVYTWRNPQTRGSRAFTTACVISIIWMIGDIIGRMSETPAGDFFGEILRFSSIPWLPVAVYVFIYQYCGKEISRRRIRLLVVIPTISWLMIMTNSWHRLYFSGMTFVDNSTAKVEYGIYFWTVHLPYSYGLLLIGFFTVLMELSRASQHYRKQIALLFVSISIPVVVNVLVTLGLIGNYTPLSFPLFFTIMAIAIFRYQFLGSNPIAYETVFKTIRDGVLILDRHDVIRDINPAAAKGLGKATSDVVGLHVREAFKAWPAIVELYEKSPDDVGEIEVTLFGSQRYLSVESTPLVLAGGAKEGRIITIRDITDRHVQQLSLEAMAFHDPLTRLANRRKFQEEVERGIKRSDENHESLAILYFDLNRFKEVNDNLGHEVGDELLKYVAARVASILRKPDLLARIGGDEFAILIHKCDENGIDLVVERLLDNVQRPFKVGDVTLVADLSIGAAFYPKDGKNLTELLRRADAEMYNAKQNGSGLTFPRFNYDSPSDLEM